MTSHIEMTVIMEIIIVSICLALGIALPKPDEGGQQHYQPEQYKGYASSGHV